MRQLWHSLLCRLGVHSDEVTYLNGHWNWCRGIWHEEVRCRRCGRTYSHSGLC